MACPLVNRDLRIGYLADHPEVLPVLKKWFETEWADYYGPTGRGNAEEDLIAYSSRDELPVGLIACHDGRLCGIAALKRDSLRTHPHLCPWVAAGLVAPALRHRGVGASLLSAVEDLARRRGYSTIYCGTSTAMGLLTRNGWQLIERARNDGEEVSIYQKVL